jgi:hypothetical protein
MKTKQLTLVTFEQAKRLTELGFDWMVDYHYNISQQKSFRHNPKEDYNESEIFYSSPSVPLALKWFEFEKGLIGFPGHDPHGWYWILEKSDDTGAQCSGDSGTNRYGCWDSREAAESALLDELSTILEENL